MLEAGVLEAEGGSASSCKELEGGVGAFWGAVHLETWLACKGGGFVLLACSFDFFGVEEPVTTFISAATQESEFCPSSNGVDGNAKLDRGLSSGEELSVLILRHK